MNISPGGIPNSTKGTLLEPSLKVAPNHPQCLFGQRPQSFQRSATKRGGLLRAARICFFFGRTSKKWWCSFWFPFRTTQRRALKKTDAEGCVNSNLSILERPKVRSKGPVHKRILSPCLAQHIYGSNQTNGKWLSHFLSSWTFNL